VTATGLGLRLSALRYNKERWAAQIWLDERGFFGSPVEIGEYGAGNAGMGIERAIEFSESAFLAENHT
jgi:hypothetical protein